PPSRTFGQEIFNSIAERSVDSFNCSATYSYSSTVLPARFAIIGISNCFKNGISVLTISFTPGFCNPIAFSILDAVSATRGVGLPSLSPPVAAFRIMAQAHLNHKTDYILGRNQNNLKLA